VAATAAVSVLWAAAWVSRTEAERWLTARSGVRAWGASVEDIFAPGGGVVTAGGVVVALACGESLTALDVGGGTAVLAAVWALAAGLCAGAP
jgi:hypothetical protein